MCFIFPSQVTYTFTFCLLLRQHLTEKKELETLREEPLVEVKVSEAGEELLIGGMRFMRFTMQTIRGLLVYLLSSPARTSGGLGSTSLRRTFLHTDLERCHYYPIGL